MLPMYYKVMRENELNYYLYFKRYKKNINKEEEVCTRPLRFRKQNRFINQKLKRPARAPCPTCAAPGRSRTPLLRVCVSAGSVRRGGVEQDTRWHKQA